MREAGGAESCCVPRPIHLSTCHRCGASLPLSKCEPATRGTRRRPLCTLRACCPCETEVTCHRCGLECERPGRGAPFYPASVCTVYCIIGVCARLAAASLQTYLDFCRRRCNRMAPQLASIRLVHCQSGPGPCRARLLTVVGARRALDVGSTDARHTHWRRGLIYSCARCSGGAGRR